MQRLLVLTLFVVFATVSASAAPVPPELEKALAAFHSEGAPGWAFVQSTESGGRTLVEHYDPSKSEFSRWTLLKKNGVPPTEEEARKHRELLSRRSPGETAPNVKDQLDRATCELVTEDESRATYRFRLQAGGKQDRSAEHMAAHFTLYKPAGTIERVELASIAPFSPVFAVKIAEAKTTLFYSVPENERPALLQRVTVRIRGRAMWFKSLDDDMVVTYSDHEYTGLQRRKPQP